MIDTTTLVPRGGDPFRNHQKDHGLSGRGWPNAFKRFHLSNCVTTWLSYLKRWLVYEKQVTNSDKNFAGEQEKRKVNRKKYEPYSLGECELEEGLCKVVSTLPHSISLWTSWRELVEFRGILFSNVELRSGSCNSFSVPDPFGSHYSSGPGCSKPH